MKHELLSDEVSGDTGCPGPQTPLLIASRKQILPEYPQFSEDVATNDQIRGGAEAVPLYEVADIERSRHVVRFGPPGNGPLGKYPNGTARDASLRVCAKVLDSCFKPTPIGNTIGVGECDVVGMRTGQPQVARGVGPRNGLVKIDDTRVRAAQVETGLMLGCPLWSVVDQEYLRGPEGLAKNAVQTAPEVRHLAVDRDHHVDGRTVCVSLDCSQTSSG
jgi:hypothetical protein